MHLLKKTYYVFLLALLFSCGQEQESNITTAAAAVPALLDRSEAIQNGKEWETVQNYYGRYKKEIMEDPEALEPRLKLAELYIQEARITGEHGHYYPAAMQMTQEVLDRNPSDPNVRFMTLTIRSGVQLSQHEFAEALQSAEEAVKLNAYNAQVYGALVDANLELGNYPKAVEMADKMVSIRPDLRSYSRVSYLREIHGQVEGAIEAMKLAVSAGLPGLEQTAWARLTLGDLHKTYGDLDKAEQQYRMVLMEREDYPFAIAALADVEMERKNYAEAEKLLNKAKAIIPEVGYYEQLAQLYMATGRQAEADKMLEEIFVMLKDDVDSGHNMNLEYAAIYRDLVKDYDKALEYAQDEYNKRPENIDVNKLMASIFLEQGELAQAEKHLQKASITNSQNPEIMAMKATLAPVEQ